MDQAIEAKLDFFLWESKVKWIHAILLPILRFGNNDEEYYQER